MLTPNATGTTREPPSGDGAGFTLIELTVALVILAVVCLGMASSAGVVGRYAAETELRAAAMQAVQDRISEIRVDPRYGRLDSIYGGTETNLTGLPGFSRKTTIEHIVETVTGGGEVDYKIISVAVIGNQITGTLSRRIVMAAP